MGCFHSKATEPKEELELRPVVCTISITPISTVRMNAPPPIPSPLPSPLPSPVPSPPPTLKVNHPEPVWMP